MMHLLQTWPVVAAAGAVIAAMAVFGAGALAQGSPPQDLRVDSEWYGGSMPPPYHHEYRVTIDGAGLGTMVMIPDYPGAGVP